MPRSFKRKALTSFSTDLGILVLDVTSAITPSYTSSLTEHPIEDGSHINDHVTHQTPTLSVSGMVTDARLRYVFRDQTGKQSQINAKDYLIKVRDQKLIVTYTDLFQIRENMILTSVSFPVSNDNMALPVELELREAIFVKTTPTTTTVSVRSKEGDEKGTQSGSDSSRNATVIRQTLDLVTGGALGG